jgi:transketolase C-terminal domain/subunit
LGINDSFGRSAENYGLLLERYHLMPEDVAAKVKKVLED